MSFLQDTLGVDDNAASLSPRAWLALLAISLMALLPGFFNLPTMDRDEARYSQASRQMMETGDYVDIRFQDQARHVKPAGIYWLQVVTTAPFGGEDAPQWAHRLPSLFGCLIAIGLVAWFGARHSGAKTGFAAGVILALGLLIAIEARTAKTDAMLLAAITMAQVALFYLFHPPENKKNHKFVGWPLVFWLAHGVGLMIKGPIITLVSVATLIPLCFWRRDWSILKRMHIPLGIGVMVMVVLPWLATITIQTQGGFIEQSLGHALMGKVAKGDDSHGAPPGYHTVALLLTYWPMMLLLPFTVAYAWRERAKPLVQYLVAWTLPTWIIFELVATKLPHYVLPVFPALTCLTALALVDGKKNIEGRVTQIAHWGFFVLFAIVAGVLGYVPYYLADEIGAASAPQESMLVVAAAVLTILAGIYLSLRPSVERLLPLAGTTVLFYIAAFAMMFPASDRFWLSRELHREVSKLEGCDAIAFTSLGYREPSIVFRFGTSTLLAATGEEAVEHLSRNEQCGLAAVSSVDEPDFMSALAAQGLSVKAHGTVEGFNYVKGDELTMTLYALAGSDFQRP